jgi:glyoxylase-like metal-dependent hydrolase (beta-lactamase superfamily II)
MAHGVLMESLAKAGVKPEDVTDVLITHSHGDHVGGLRDAAGKSAFPKAVIRMSAKEWASLQANDGAKALVAAIGAQVQTFEPGATVAPGITAVAIDGHTPGHMGYEIVSNGERLLDIGDMAHSSIVSLARPDWAMGFDGDKAAAKASRMAVLKRVSATGEAIFAPHFPFPGVGKVAVQGQGYVWVPMPQPKP